MNWTKTACEINNILNLNNSQRNETGNIWRLLLKLAWKFHTK